MKGIGKISAKLGPVGMMALSFVLAPVMGPMISSLWSGFGAGAAAMATSANAFVSTLGSIGSGVFATGNFIGGTLGAMGNAITESASNVMAGNFSGAASSFATNMSNAFTGKAGMAAVNAGAAQAAMASGNLVGSTDALTAQTGSFGVDQTAGFNAEVAANQAGLSTDLMAPTDLSSLQAVTNNGTVAGLNPLDVTAQTAVAGTQELAGQALYGKAGNLTLTEQDAFMKYGADGVRAIQPISGNGNGNGNKLKEVADNYGKVKSLLGGGSQETGYQPYTPRAIQSQTISNAGTARGQGSAGFSLLGGVQGLEQSVRNSQNMMFG
jgi:hypothetical protein